eukprot:8269842-Pyramimonas_sp.AAC.1
MACAAGRRGTQAMASEQAGMVVRFGVALVRYQCEEEEKEEEGPLSMFAHFINHLRTQRQVSASDRPTDPPR